MLANLGTVCIQRRLVVGINVERVQNIRAVRKVKRGKIREVINVEGGNVCTD